MTDYATMKVYPETLVRLKTAKRRGESYDLLLNRLMDDADVAPAALAREAGD